MNNRLKTKVLLTLTVLCTASMAQAANPGKDPHQMSRIMTDTFMWVEAGVLIGALITIVYLAQTMMHVQKMRMMQEKGIEVMEKAGLIRKEPLWKSLYKKMTGVVPIEKEADVMLDHDYDGIRELDNSLPPWWVALFYISIGLGVVHLVYYYVADIGLSQKEKYEIKMEEAEVAVLDYLEKQADRVNENNVAMLTDEASLATGQKLFLEKCATCHGQLGEGGVGPNLCDPYWLHGGSIKDVFKVVKNGVTEKGMIAWKTQMRPMDIHKVSSFIMSFQGTNPPNAKEPQGDLYVSKDSTPKTDTMANDKATGMLIK